VLDAADPLLEPLPLGVAGAVAPNRVLFGPHVTNLGDDARRLTERHVAYYAARARGGCGTIVVEGASVHPSDWPYERAPLASRCAAGWRAVADACHAHGSLVIASLDHAGGQGSSAYSQAPLWAPSRVPEVSTREVPKWMEPHEIAAVVDGFAGAARAAVDAGCDGVEVNAGQHSLVRQFLSGLTNQRGDEWGQDRLRFARDVLAAVRGAAGSAVVGLRLSCDELAPWAGVTPDAAPAIATALAETGIDYLVAVRGSIFSVEKTRPDHHEPQGFNLELCRSVRDALQGAPRAPAVFLQGSVVRWQQAADAVTAGACDGVEMTRAQIADANLVGHLREGHAERIRPCILCNQACQVRDARNPLVSCVGEPSSGHETTDPDWTGPARTARDVLVVGGGVAGLEAARVAAARGHRVRLVERDASLGGVAAIAGPGRPLVDWLVAECERLGVRADVGHQLEAADLVGGSAVVQATGGRPGRRQYGIAEGAVVVDVVDVHRRAVELPADGTIVLFDPIGGPIAVELAERLGARALLVTQDHIVGGELSRTGDLAPANVRLAQRGSRVLKRALLREVRPGEVVVEDRFTGERTTHPAAAVVDCGFRLPTEPLEGAVAIGDAVAPRTILEAVLEGRRAAHSL